MRKLVLLVVILIMGIALAGCQKAPQSTTSTMTPVEVIQHVNQVLENEYIYQGSTVRYEIRYAALSALYGEPVYGRKVADVNEEMNRTIKALSPEALRIYREMLREGLKTWSQQERETALYRLRGITEVEDIVLEFQGIYPEGAWLVNVKVVKEPQKLNEGQWVVTRALTTETYTQQYYFCETTGALIKW